MTTAPTPTIITTITKASDAANRSLNKKTAAQAAVFLFPFHLLIEHLRAPNPGSGAISLQVTARAKCLVTGSFAVNHHLLTLANNAVLA
jgi:hypothetical protein